MKAPLAALWRRGAASQEKRAELAYGALAVGLLVVIALIVVTVLSKAWPSFAHNGLAWFGPGGTWIRS